MQFGLLFRRQFVFERDGQSKMQPLDFSFRIQHFVELSQRLLLVNRIRLHKRVQRFHRILHLPLQFIEACRRLLNLRAHESLLLLRKIEFTRVAHDQFRGKHDVTQRIHRRRWLLRRLLSRNQSNGQQRSRGHN